VNPLRSSPDLSALLALVIDRSDRDTVPDADPDLPEDRPTLPPPPLASVVRYRTGAPVDELQYRLAMGDHVAALAAAEDLFEGGYVPVALPSVLTPMELNLGYRECTLLTLIDGETPLATVLQSSGLDQLDALRALCELVEAELVTLTQKI
jgi:hypothetical protein